MTHVTQNWLDHDTLLQSLERILPELGWDASLITNVCSARSSLSTSYDTGVVTAHFRGGAMLKLFLKNYDNSMRPRDESIQRREREIKVYEHLLRNGTLGTAEYYGSVWDDLHGLHWLLLEYVEGMQVGHLSIDYWIEAAAWLGRIHGHFAHQTDRLNRCSWLARHDADFFLGNADNALRTVTEIAPHLQASLEPIVKKHALFVPDMIKSPFTLIHGSYFAHNIICPATNPTRMCVIDWETAGFGSPYYDLARFVAGFAPPVLDLCLQRYAETAGQFGMSVTNHANIRHLVNCFRLHLIIRSLSHGSLRGYTETALAKLITSARQRCDETRRSANEQA